MKSKLIHPFVLKKSVVFIRQPIFSFRKRSSSALATSTCRRARRTARAGRTGTRGTRASDTRGTARARLRTRSARAGYRGRTARTGLRTRSARASYRGRTARARFRTRSARTSHRRGAARAMVRTRGVMARTGIRTMSIVIRAAMGIMAGSAVRIGTSRSQHRGRIPVNGCIHAAVRTLMRLVAVSVVGRTGMAVHMGRIMVVTMVPGSRTPVRHKATGRNRRNGENGSTGSRVAIHRATIVITVNGEAVGVIASGSPRHG